MCVNLSAVEFRDPALVDDLGAILRDCGLPAGGLELEITEGVVMADAPGTAEALARLKALGVRLALDDFGTGYSSLAYLKRFPVDALKIDRSFVAGLGRDPVDTALVGAVVTLGHALGLQVVAEGVATAGHAARLAALGCDLGQGYHFAPPLPPDEAGALLGDAGITVENGTFRQSYGDTGMNQGWQAR
jgi:EAL domain-containing protein (putative c-di-GMP-specific phosphodiesterase class I)